MSTSYPAWSLTSYPDAMDKNNENIRKEIVDFDKRSSDTDPMLYHILAGDVKGLQQAVFAVQETLGIRPQSSFGTVDLRIAALEDYEDLDERFGGSTWRGLWTASHDVNGDPIDGIPLPPTIMGHLHDGSTTGAPKIDLSRDVTGVLSKAGIDLANETGITGEDIKLSSGSTKTITERFDDKYDKTGGSLSGPVAVGGTFNSQIYKEADAYWLVPGVGSVGTQVADQDAYSGQARKVLASGGAGNLLYYGTNMRYGDYSVGLRMKVSSVDSPQAVGKVVVYSSGTMVKTVDIIPNRFESVEYQMFYVTFKHKRGTSADKSVQVYVKWSGSSVVPVEQSCDLTADSIVITPVHPAVFDRDGV